jgi:hypothetical protein
MAACAVCGNAERKFSIAWSDCTGGGTKMRLTGSAPPVRHPSNAEDATTY